MKKDNAGELLQFFHKITTPVEGTEDRVLDFDTFKELIDTSLEKGFNHGHSAGVKQAEELVREALNRIDPD